MRTSELAQPMRKTTLTLRRSATLQLTKSVTGPTLSRTCSNGAQPSKGRTRRPLKTAQTCERGQRRVSAPCGNSGEAEPREGKRTGA